MEGFVQGKAIPNIKKLIEKVFWDMRRKVSPFPGACKITLGRQLSPSPRLKANPADSQQLIGGQGCTIKKVQASRSSQNPGRKIKFSKTEWPTERDPPRLVHPAESQELPPKEDKNLASESSLPSPEKYHFLGNLALTHKIQPQSCHIGGL